MNWIAINAQNVQDGFQMIVEMSVPPSTHVPIFPDCSKVTGSFKNESVDIFGGLFPK